MTEPALGPRKDVGRMVSFLDDAEPSVVLIGLPMFPEAPSEGAACAVLLGDDAYYEVPPSMRPFLEFVSSPRTVVELEQWLQAGGSPGDSVDLLVESRKMLKVEPGTPTDTLGQFGGLRLTAECEALPWPNDEPPVDNVTFVGRVGYEGQAIPISSTLASAMWDRLDGEDLVASVERLHEASQIGRDEFVAEALEWLPGLLASGYAYLAPVRD